MIAVLLVEDSEDDAMLILRELRRAAGEVRHARVETPEDLKAALAEGPWDIVISDLRMPSFNGMAALAMVRAARPDLPFLMVSATIEPAVTRAALDSGAADCVMKYELKKLVPAIRRLFPHVGGSSPGLADRGLK